MSYPIKFNDSRPGFNGTAERRLEILKIIAEHDKPLVFVDIMTLCGGTMVDIRWLWAKNLLQALLIKNVMHFELSEGGRSCIANEDKERERIARVQAKKQEKERTSA